MKRFYTLLVPLLVVCAAALVLSRTGCVDLFRTEARGERRVLLPRSGDEAASTSPAELLARYTARVDERFRLRPDARFLGAFRELEHIVTGQSAGLPNARLENGRWTLESGGHALARDLPELPTFADWLAALDAFARTLLAERPDWVRGELALSEPVRARLASWNDAEIVEVLAAADARWRTGERRGEDLAACTRALAELSLLLIDDLQRADRVASRALAALALTRVLDPERARRDEVLLAFALDHSRHAAERATGLDAGDAVALLALGDDAELARRAGAAGGNDARELRGFQGLALARPARPQAWLHWYRALPAEEQSARLVLRSAFLAADTAVRRSTTSAALQGVVQTFAREEAAARAASDAVLLGRARSVRRGIDTSAQSLAGPWLDADLYRDFQTAYWLSALYQRGEVHRELGTSMPDAEKFGRVLAESDDEDLRVLSRWYAGLVDPQAAKRHRAALLRDLRTPSILGPLQRQATLERLAPDASDPDADELLADLAAHFDARPELLLRAAELSRRHWQDLALEERLDGAALAADGPHHVERAAWLAGQARDAAALWKMADARGAAARSAALAELATRPAPDLDRIEAGYAREWRERRDEAELVLDYTQFLSRDRGQHERAAELVRQYLARNDDGSPELRRRLASYERRAGRASEAWSALEPALASHRRTVLDEGVRILLDLGRAQQAEELARDLRERHPQLLSAAVALAEALWRQDRHEDAADVLRDAQTRASPDEQRRLLPRAFADAFAEAPEARALDAWQHLLDVQLRTPALLACIAELRARGKLELSVALAERVRMPEHAHALHLAAYPGLRTLRGDPTALQWLVDRIGPAELNHAAVLFFQERQDHLLWETFALAATPPNESGWRWRAAAAARGRPLTPGQRLELERYYTNPPRNFEDRIGQMLIGVISEKQLFAQAHTPALLCQAAYASALHALGRGQYREGARWLQIAIATQGDTGERVLAEVARDDLAARGKTLARLEYEHEHATAPTTADAER